MSEVAARMKAGTGTPPYAPEAVNKLKTSGDRDGEASAESCGQGLGGAMARSRRFALPIFSQLPSIGGFSIDSHPHGY